MEYTVKSEKYDRGFYKVFIMYKTKIVLQSHEIYPENRGELVKTRGEFEEIAMHANKHNLSISEIRGQN